MRYIFSKGALNCYNSQDYITQKRAAFIYYINVAFLFLILFISAYTAYLDIINPDIGEPNVQMQIIFVILFLIFLISLFLLQKGYLDISSNLLLISSLVAIWGNMFFDEVGGIYQLDTIVYIYAILSMLPLVISKNKFNVFIYVIINFIILFVFTFKLRKQFSINNSEFLDYLIDSIVALIIQGIIVYNIFTINNKALIRAKNEIEKRNIVEKELLKHKANLLQLVNEKTKDLQTMNEELKVTNEELFEKNEIIQDQNSELKATLLHLEKTQDQLIHAEKMASIGILTSGVAHEINNPLNFINGGYTEIMEYMRENAPEHYENLKSMMDIIGKGVERASKIVNGLNQLSRTTASMNELCNVHEILENTLIVIQSNHKQNIEITKEFNAQKYEVAGNTGQLHQVFINILANAVQSIENTGVISIKTQNKNNTICIIVCDTGKGIEKENVEKIFTPFFTTKPPGEGTGLGLSISYNIIKEHKGDIKFDSEIDVGTTFSIELPVYIA